MRRNHVNLGLCITAASIFLGQFNSTAHATFHLWEISQVYSNASGSVQFIQFQQPNFEFDDERFLTEANLADSTFSHLFSFPTDLPSAPQANQYFLVATPGYAALPGVPAPDYVLPSNNWFSASGDTLTYAGGVDSVTWTSGLLPTDGVHSLFRAYGSPDLTSGINSITNFAGATGTISVPEPGSLALALGILCLQWPRRRNIRR